MIPLEPDNSVHPFANSNLFAKETIRELSDRFPILPSFSKWRTKFAALSGKLSCLTMIKRRFVRGALFKSSAPRNTHFSGILKSLATSVALLPLALYCRAKMRVDIPVSLATGLPKPTFGLMVTPLWNTPMTLCEICGRIVREFS